MPSLYGKFPYNWRSMDGFDRTRASMKTTSEERIDLRIPSSVKQRLKHVASLTGRSMSDFIIAAAMDRADEVNASIERWELTEADSLVVLDLLSRPRDVSSLRALFAEHASLISESKTAATRELVEV